MLVLMIELGVVKVEFNDNLEFLCLLWLLFCEFGLWVLLLVIVVGYVWKLIEFLIYGEELRWVWGVVLMLEIGDFIVLW